MSIIGEDLMAKIASLRDEGKLIPSAELVRMVKDGPGTKSLGDAQAAARRQSQRQAEIEERTLKSITRMESCWTGDSADIARGALRPLADVATAASEALRGSQNTLTDQAHVFERCRDSMVEISPEPPQRGLGDVLAPWDTDTEDAINRRNAGIEHNKRVYTEFQGFASTNGAAMPIDYGQIGDSSTALLDLDNPSADMIDDPGTVTPRPDSGDDDGPDPVERRRWSAPPVDPPFATPPQWNPPQQPPAPRPGSPDVSIPAASDDSTTAAGFVPPMAGGTPYSFGPTGSATPPPYTPPPGQGGYGSGGYVPGGSGGYPGTGAPGGTGRPPAPGAGGGSGSGSGRPRGQDPHGQGRSTGSVTPRSGEPAPRFGGTAPRPAGSGTARGMPMGGAGGGGKRSEDEEHQKKVTLVNPDVDGTIGYDGQATPPVIGETRPENKPKPPKLPKPHDK